MQRPTGVTILAVLAIIAGGLHLLPLCAVLGIGGVATVLTGPLGLAVGGILTLLTIPMLIIGILQFAVGIGALQLQPWAWMVGVVAQVATLIVNVIGVLSPTVPVHIGSMIVAAIILYYLMTPPVKQAFGRP